MNQTLARHQDLCSRLLKDAADLQTAHPHLQEAVQAVQVQGLRVLLDNRVFQRLSQQAEALEQALPPYPRHGSRDAHSYMEALHRLNMAYRQAEAAWAKACVELKELQEVHAYLLQLAAPADNAAVA